MTAPPLCPACQEAPTWALLCDRCWDSLPGPVRSRVRRAWDEWAGDGFGLFGALEDYRAAAAAAVSTATELIVRAHRHEARVEAILAGKEPW